MYRIVIDKKVWSVNLRVRNNVMGLAKEQFEKKNVNAIYAVEKEDSIILQKKLVFGELKDLIKYENDFKQKGFKVYSVRRKEYASKRD